MNVNNNNFQVIPSGLLRKVPLQDAALRNIELKLTLDKAVDEADLNVTERLALNEEFFPNGGGFDLFKDNQQELQMNIFFNNNSKDEFTKTISEIEIPENVSYMDVKFIKSSKSNLQANLENALKKLADVMKTSF